VFSHLDDWLAPRLAAGAADIYGEVLAPSACPWEPVGTPSEYLEANLHPQRLSYFDADARARAIGVHLEDDLVIGAGAMLGRGVVLERAVVWDGERVPDGFCGRVGVHAGGAFHAVTEAGDAS
jgi:NDP-sugar pyrophosphorylase family protein